MLPFLPNNSFNSHHSDYLPLQINLSSNAFLDSSDSDEDSYKDAGKEFLCVYLNMNLKLKV